MTIEENLKYIAKFYPDSSAFFEAFKKPAFRGIRVNTLKIDRKNFLKFYNDLKPTPFCENGFYIDEDFKPGKDPMHHAGAYYVQEPSATSAAEILDVNPGDYILDLCAAPGGKSTQIAAKLQNTGLLWSNEPVIKRAAVLISNFERMGVKNGIVSSAMPDMLAKKLEGCFDKVLVDAPCSGEGMLKKEAAAALCWSKENVNACALRQQKILNSAAVMLRDGGTLLYSTCTFSLAENENNVNLFLREHTEFSLSKINVDFGREGVNLKEVRRIFPQDGGEGHFIAKFTKVGSGTRRPLPITPDKMPDIKLVNMFEEFKSNSEISFDSGSLISNGGKIYLSPVEGFINGCGVLRQGVLLNEQNDKRFVPSHAMYACPFICSPKNIDLEADDIRVKKFLHGEEIELNESLKGFTRVTLQHIPLGFGKASGNTLKNYYPKGLRTL